MANVYMNPEKLEGRIAGLEDFAQSAIESRATIHCMYANDPIKSGESLGSLELAVVNAANAIKSHAEELRKCKTTMVNLNSNGVANHDLEGGVSIEVPDDSAGLETADKFQKWAQGATDAHDLRSGEGRLPSGRSIDEVRESMKANKDDTTYANSVIDRIGPENLTWIGSADPDSNKEAPVLGEILATASKTWDTPKSERNADLIAASIDGIRDEKRRDSIQLEEHRIAIFNKMIGEHDSDGDGVSDLSFSSAFLQRLGTRLEVIKPNKVEATLSTYGDDNTMPEEVSQKDIDPLWGVIDAMTNNAEAAAVFFGNKGVNANEDDIDRTRNIVIRGDLGDNKRAKVAMKVK